MADLDKARTSPREKSAGNIEELKAFKDNFKLASESPNYSKKKPHSERLGSDKGSVELSQRKEELKSFHSSFKLDLSHSKPDGQKKPAVVNGTTPSSRTTPSSSEGQERKVKRKKRRPPKFLEFEDVYQTTGEELGKGSHSSVMGCIHKTSGEEFAVKIVPKTSTLQREKVHKEVEILYMCKGSRFVLHLVELFEDTKVCHLVFYRMYGGPLLKHIQQRKTFTEREAGEVIKEVTEALNFLHGRGVAHRDLKPENILCEKKDQVVPVRICDFDLSSTIMPTSSSQTTPITTPMLHTPVGSAEFMAPEVVEAFLGDGFSYDKKCDLWSLGVTLYLMLCGEAPFKGGCGQPCGWEEGESCRECQGILLSRIQKCEYSFPDNYWRDISEDAKSLVRSLLQTDSKLRPSAKEVLRHPWLEQAAPDTPLHTPVVLKSFPGCATQLSNIVASCLACERQRAPASQAPPPKGLHAQSYSPERPFSLSPPGTSELALRRDFHLISS